MSDGAAAVAQVKGRIGEETFRELVGGFVDGYLGLADMAMIPENELDNLHELGRLQITIRQFERAARILKMLVHIKPHHGPYWGTYGIALQNLGDYLRARTAYQVAIELVPKALEYRVYAAECELQLNHPQYALEVLEPVFHLKGDKGQDGVALLQRAQRLRALVDRVESAPDDKAGIVARRKKK